MEEVCWKIKNPLAKENVNCYVCADEQTKKLVEFKEFTKFIGCGQYGCVYAYQGSKSTYSNVVMKIFVTEKNEGEREYEISKIASNLKIGPLVYGVFSSPINYIYVKSDREKINIGNKNLYVYCIFMQLLETDLSLFQLKKNIYLSEKKSNYNFLITDLYKKAKENLKILHQTGITHNDLHDMNIFVTRRGDVIFIDFGGTSLKKEKNWKRKIKEDQRIMKLSFFH